MHVKYVHVCVCVGARARVCTYIYTYMSVNCLQQEVHIFTYVDTQ